MIFSFYSRVLVKLGEDEKHVYDSSKLLFTEVQEIQKVTEWSWAEWQHQLGRHDITAVAALLHVLRRRDGQPSDFAGLQFNAADLEVVPLHDDDREFTAAEIMADILKRNEEAREAANPTSATAGPAAAVAPPQATTSTSPSSPNGSTSGRGSGNGSPGGTSRSARRTSTRS